MTTRRSCLKLAACLPFASVAWAGGNSAWSRPVRLVVPFAPGGASDILARQLSKPLGERLGQSVIVENRPGANANIGTTYVARSTDDHTFLLCDIGSLAISASLYKDLGYELNRDLQGVATLSYSAYLLLAHPRLPADSLAELVDLSKRQQVRFAAAGAGSPNHLAGVDLAQRMGIQWQYIPYKGGSQAMNDTLAGTTDVVINSVFTSLPLVRDGRVKLLGVGSLQRDPLLPDAPTLAEQGARDFQAGGWQGILAPASVTAERALALQEAVLAVIAAPAFRAQLQAGGAQWLGRGREATTAFMYSEQQRWAAVLKQAGDVLAM